jgi:hypothetical protein
MFVNGSYVARGSDTGIGAGQGGTVQNITILDGLMTAKGGGGAGIGARFGNSLVNRVEIQGGEVRAESVLGAGIGSGNANVSWQQSRVDTVQVLGGKVTANSLNGSGIGSGQAALSITSSIGSNDISSRNFQLKNERGAGLDQDMPSRMEIRLLKFRRLLMLMFRRSRLLGEELDQDLLMGLEGGQPLVVLPFLSAR